jgi:hypothetical protein
VSRPDVVDRQQRAVILRPTQAHLRSAPMSWLDIYLAVLVVALIGLVAYKLKN